MTPRLLETVQATLRARLEARDRAVEAEARGDWQAARRYWHEAGRRYRGPVEVAA